jgi:1-aminocyclopropane-1-carboxylate deaminase/D-cysteine desulfhydrase-like pyridoxal-dependent ACC family enzyme
MLTVEEMRERLTGYPRLSYGSYPTPIEPLDNLTKALNGPQLWIKRDDGIGPGMGGNKGRKLEFIMAEALAKGKSKVATFGGLQSNHARMTAAACAALGLEAHLYFFERRPKKLEGNLMLDKLFGAHMHFIPFGAGGDASMTINTTNRLVRLVSLAIAGPGTYFIPVGGHNVTGCLGYVNAALELHEQVAEMGLADRRVTVITAAGTGGTLTGLTVGFSMLDSRVGALGIDVGKLWKAFPASLARLASELCFELEGGARTLPHLTGRLHRKEPCSFRPEALRLIEGEYAGRGYGVPSEEAGAAIRLRAESEGILLDPLYTGKAFAGVLDMIKKGRFRRDQHVIFLHTGGAPGLWARDFGF